MFASLISDEKCQGKIGHYSNYLQIQFLQRNQPGKGVSCVHEVASNFRYELFPNSAISFQQWNIFRSLGLVKKGPSSSDRQKCRAKEMKQRKYSIYFTQKIHVYHIKMISASNKLTVELKRNLKDLRFHSEKKKFLFTDRLQEPITSRN